MHKSELWLDDVKRVVPDDNANFSMQSPLFSNTNTS